MADVLALHCHIWLVLLASIISQCGAIEYYVKPTDFTNDTCPGQPCLTINEYTNASTYYIKSNTVFTFLPGKHIVLRPIVLVNVVNVSLRATLSDTKLTAQFNCENITYAYESEGNSGVVKDVACCSVISVVGVVYASVNLNIEIMNPSVITGITILKSNVVQIQTDVFRTGFLGNGVKVSQCSVGLKLLHTLNTNISNSLFSYNKYGMQMVGARNNGIEKVKFINNRRQPLYLEDCLNTYIVDMYASNNGERIAFKNCIHTIIENFVSYNQFGLGFYWSEVIRLRNVTVYQITHNNSGHYMYSGIAIQHCIDTTVVHSYSHGSYNSVGILVNSSKNVAIFNALISSNIHGIRIERSIDVTLVNISIGNLQRKGLDVIVNYGVIVDVCKNVSISNLSVTPFRTVGLFINRCYYNGMTLENSNFSNIYSTNTKKHLLQSAIVSIQETDLTLRDCVFINNNITSIQAIRAPIDLHGNIVFANNRALNGAVFVLAKHSSITTFSDTNVTFQNNSAVNYGGVFYIITQERYSACKSLFDIQTDAQVGSQSRVETVCFITTQLQAVRSEKKLSFSGNTAGKGGDVLFGDSVASGWDGHINCLDAFKSISNFSEQNMASLVSSAPSRVCLCYNSEKDCQIVADPNTHTIYPGETITIPVVVVGHDFGTATGSVIAKIMVPSGLSSTSDLSLKEGQSSVLFEKGPCTNLMYTFYTNCVDCQAVLVLKTDNSKVLEIMTAEDNHKLNYTLDLIRSYKLYGITEKYLREHEDFASSLAEKTIDNFIIFTDTGKWAFPKEIYYYPLYINVSFRSCPGGFSLTALSPFKCDCINLLKQMPGVKCTIQDQLISRVGSVWIGKYGNGSVATSKYCPLNYCNINKIDIALMDTNSTQHSPADTDVQCNYNRSGILCGGCQPGLSLALGSDRCLKCSTNFIFLLLPYAIAGIILVLFIKVLNLTISEGTLNGLIFYANVIKANRYLYYDQTSVNPMTLFIAWLNLDLGIETCFVNGLTAYGRTWLQFVFPLYIWSIAILIIILAKYSNRMAKMMGNNGVPVLATLFLLSYAKLFNTILTVLSYTTLYTSDGQELVWSADGNIVYLGHEHAPLFAVAVATLLLLWLPYTLLILVGQWLHRFNFRIVNRYLLKLKPFLDAHYAAFKPRHHYWFGLLLVIRAATLLSSAVIPSDNANIVVFSIALSSVLLTYWGQNVYWHSATTNFSIAFFINLSFLNLTKLFVNNTNSEVLFTTFTGISLLQFIGLVLHKLVSLAKRNKKGIFFLISKCWRGPTEGEVDHFAMTSTEKEMESESNDEEEMLKDDDTDNFPNY